MKICSFESCDKNFFAKGLCQNHYYQQRNADPNRPPCTVTDCDSGRPQYGNTGLCTACYARKRNTGTTNRQVSKKGEGVEWLKSLLTEDSDGGCRDWPFGESKNYGRTTIDGKTMTASRASLILSTGIDPEGLFCRHSCHRPICVAPWHLSWGTPDDNFYDIIRRVISLHEEGLSEDEIIQQFKESWR